MIVVAGEALIDLVPQQRGDALTPLRPVRGGGPYNTAVALARLGGAAAFCSRLSTDGFGTSLLERLSEEGVATGLVQRGPEPTTLAVAAVGADGSASYSFYTGGTADRLFTLPPALPEQTRAVSFGTCSLVLEPGASAYEELMRREAGRGVFVALDPNVRGELIPDADAYRSRFRSWLPYVSLLKLSEEDADWLGLGLPELAAAGPAAVVLTRGGDGLTVRTRDGAEYAVPGEKVEVVDTIGAGDTVNAALLHALSARDLLTPGALAELTADGWAGILTFAARAAAVTCSRAGAEPPYGREVEEFASR
ncbi:carbohydrate kinase [Streptomyces albidoflavus]|uniref:Carbohydrate kinase n=1 Tax=Streptomyces albidoflavus TaxID=1886 RepID=A0A8G2E3J3_9ACTN|nr:MULTISPECIES: carbohydrate kinase [Streptomyces]MYX49393.1 carbohydrate kinase [Streptomyces sp. SID8385]SCE09787.1 fructokinase [Streptomyces sp. IgraMP-1]ALM37522.1 Fructokinase [Streptomyces sp. FR-008]KAF0791915.1 sugar kinase [Streptomyces sp. FR-008]MBK3381628.1 carbohydrate kinase [Streptomyces sp. DEF147AK]